MPILLGDLYCICVGVLPTVGGMDARLATTAAASNPPQLAPLASPLARGYALGLLGVVLFALTIPMTRLAGGTALAPELPPSFVALGRAAVAGLCSAAYLLAVRAAWPARADWPWLALTCLGVVFGFPLLLGLAVREVDAMHAAVVTGLLPMATAALAAAFLRQRASWGFWLSAWAGLGLVLGYAAWRGAGGLNAADGLLFAAVLLGAAGYVGGGQLARRMPAQQVICWVLVLALPLTVPSAALSWPQQPASVAAWAGFAYVSLVSMWLGFFAWYRALALGGTLRISQVQVLQPFLSMLFAVPLLGEPLEAGSLAFAAAVVAVVWWGRRQAVQGGPTR